MMIPALEYIKPNTLDDALEVLHQNKTGAKIIAGGTDVITGLQQGSSRFKDINLLVDLNRIEELKKIEKRNDKIILGANTTFTDVVKNSLLNENYPLLVKAASTVGSLQIRNRATLAGNFTNNAPCADSVPPLLVYNAMIKIQSILSVREISLQDFLLGPYKTQLKNDEVITEILLPIPDKNLKGEFYKLGRRRAVSISRITLAILAKITNSFIDEIRIASGAVTPIGRRFYNIEKFAHGKIAQTETFKNIAMDLGKEVLELTGLRWSSAYKLPVVQQMIYQLLEKNLGNNK